MPFEKAAQEIQRCAGTHFDPVVVQSFLTIPLGVFEEIRRQSLE
jgi:response regulator RpfG family c-di-GMP phosphodiesterase